MIVWMGGGFSKMRKNGTAEGDVNVWVEIAQNSVKHCIAVLTVYK